MQENFGNQGGFEGLKGAAEQFNVGSGLFKTSVGDWTFGILSFKKIVESGAFKSITSNVIELSGVLKGLTGVFSVSKVVDSVTDLSNSLYETRKELEKIYGIFGRNNEVVKSLTQQSRETVEFGIGLKENVKAYKALATVFRSRTFDSNLAGLTAKISKAFDIGEESAANIVAPLSKFGGKDSKGITKFFDDVNKSSFEAGISHELVAENMASSSSSMYRFRVDTDKGEAKFKKLAIHSTKMGVSIGHMVEAMDKYRTIPGAVEGSVTASLAGMNISANQLLAGARGTDPSQMFTAVFDHLNKFTDENGALSSVGVDIADILGPMINMGRDEIQDAMMKMSSSGEVAGEFYTNWQDRLKRQQTIQEKMENSLYGILDAVYRLSSPLFDILEFITRHTTLTQALLVATASGWAWAKAGGAIKGGISALRSGGVAGLFSHIKGDRGAEYPTPTSTGSGGTSGGKARRPDGTFGRGMSQKQMAGQSQMMTAQAKQMAASAIPMLAFAGAIWILAKAFQQFGEVNWKEAKYGGLVMGGFVASMAVIGKIAVASMSSLIGLGLAAIGISLAMVAIAKAGQMLEGISLVDIGLGLGALSIGMLALAAVGAVMSTGFGAIAMGLGLIGVVSTIAAIGVVSAKYANNIETLSYALERLAGAMERLRAIDSGTIPIKIDKGTVKELERVTLDMARNGAITNREIIENHITIDMDGVKLARQLVKTTGLRIA